MIITVARECGSGGHSVGQKLAQHYGIKCFDRHVLVTEAKKTGKYDELESFFSEKPVNSLLYSIVVNNGKVRAGRNTLELFKSLIQEESFVLIGRCGNYIYKDAPDLTSVFVHADNDIRINRTAKKQSVDHIKAAEIVEYVDEKRKTFHSYYTGQSWGDAKNYQLCIDSGILGVDETVDMIIDFIEKKKQ